MASALTMMKRNGLAAGGSVAKGAIVYGSGRLLARYCHGKKDSARVPVAVAALGKGVAALGHLFLGDAGVFVEAGLGALDAAGDGGLGFLGVLHGLRDARKAKGVRAIMVPATADVKTLPAGSVVDADLLGSGEGLSYGQEVTLGALGRAQPGATMSLDRIREIQAMR